MKLQPIETAPKDGTHILLYGELEDDFGVVNDDETETTPIKAFLEGYYGSISGWYHMGSFRAHPTHWMPLHEIKTNLKDE